MAFQTMAVYTTLMVNQDLLPLKGFRDFLPSEAKKRQYALNIIRSAFETFGFEPLETPALERQELLLGKYGSEADKLVYKFEDEGKRPIGLRYDQTVPTARVIAGRQNDLILPFKRYQIQPVWRAEKPQQGRFREFLQCDIDTFGTPDLLADAEIIATALNTYRLLGFKNTKVLLNSRIVLFELMDQANIPKNLHLTILQSLDKLGKLPEEAISAEMTRKGLNPDQSASLFALVASAVPSTDLKKVIELCTSLGINNSQLEFSPTLVRGLDYYTATIFEVVCDDYPAGSIGGGGRYDKLIESLSGLSIPAVGFAVGFDRTLQAMETLNLFPKDLTTPAKVLVTLTDEYLLDNCLKIAALLRLNGIATYLYPTVARLDKQLKFADKKGVPYVIILGTQEAAADLVSLKDLSTGKQINLPVEELVLKLR